ncbi:MAG: membrane protein insertase YidC [Candidatus Magasanikbacteria bacterium]|jgi:YidC/Oxa1 family membrane protein insertase|nr:membrane protein insertase YidC [Candidatus Magasanikbacteria bacterium]
MGHLFEIILFQPIFNGFVALYNVLPDVGLVILIITVIIKVVLYPLTTASIKAQKSLTELQPKLEELKQKHKGNQQEIAQETMKLYKEHKVNPLGSCLPILIQLPIFLALYFVFRDALANSRFELLYSFVTKPEYINSVTLQLFDLGKPNVVLAVLAGGAQFFQAKMFIRKNPPKQSGTDGKNENMMSIMNKQMLYLMPIMTLLIGLQLPGGLSLYWFLSTILTFLQQHIVFRQTKNDSGTPSDVLEGTLVK